LEKEQKKTPMIDGEESNNESEATNQNEPGEEHFSGGER
jgi:hypothetical protein